MNRLCLFIFLSCIASVSYAQEMVFPGDANGDGIVDQYDLLSIGYAFGETGPARIQTEDISTAQGIPVFWGQTFPSGSDYIYADCNGNGVVDYLDFIPFRNNFNTVLDDANPLVIQPGLLGLDPTIIWNNGVVEIAVTEGVALNIPVAIPLNDELAINGLAYSIRYESSLFQSINYSTDENWLRSDEQAMGIVVKEENEVGLFQVATTRFGVDPVSGGGNEGVLNLIVIIDLIDYLEGPDDTLITKIYLEDIFMIDGNFNQIPIVPDTLTLQLYHDITSSAAEPQIINNGLKATAFPNPSKGEFRISAIHAFNNIELVDALGRTQQLYKGEPVNDWYSEELNINQGLYTIRMSGDKGNAVLKYLVVK